MTKPDQMPLDAPLWAAVFSGAIAVALLVLVAVVIKRQTEQASLCRWMVALIASITFGIWESWLLESGLYRLTPHLLGIFNGALLLVGPCLWGYASALVGKPQKWCVNLVHFAPFFLYTIWLSSIFLLEDAAHKILVAELSLSMEYQVSIIAWFKLSHLALYGLLTLRLIRKTRSADKSYFSSLGVRDLAWLTRLVRALLVAIMMLILAEPFSAVGYLDIRSLNNIATLGLAMLILVIAAQSLSQPPLEDVIDQDLDAPRYARSGIGADLLQTFVQRVECALTHEQLYTDPELNLTMLARAAGLTLQQASQAINQGMQMTFYDLVNDKRVAEAKRQLLADNGSILDAALNSGFANKATFNKAFKARCGMTPSVWRAKEGAHFK